MWKGSGTIRELALVLLSFTISFLLTGIHISLKLLSGDVEQVRISCLHFLVVLTKKGKTHLNQRKPLISRNIIHGNIS